MSMLPRNATAVTALARGNIELWANLLVITWAIVFMLWQGTGFAITVGTVFAIWAILAVSLNLVVGFTGLLSVGHIGFFGIGAYTMAILTSNASYEAARTDAIPTYGWPFFAALPVSIVVAGIVAIIVGVAFNRFRDDIFVLVSFGFAIIAFNTFLNLRELTRGAFGIHEIERPAIGGWVIDGELEFLLFSEFAVFLSYVQIFTLFMMAPLFNVMARINRDLIEAAKDNGASGLQILMHVIIPLCKPGLAIGAIFVIALVASDFTAIRILSGARVGTVMASMSNQIYNVQYPPASASAIILMLAVLIIVGIIMRLVDVRKQL